MRSIETQLVWNIVSAAQILTFTLSSVRGLFRSDARLTATGDNLFSQIVGSLAVFFC